MSATGVPGRVAVLGLGLVGGSLARLLHARGVAVVGQDVDPGTVAAARAAGLRTTADVAEAVDGADLVVLAVPLRAMRATAAEVARHLGPDATLTDVGSVKGPVRQAVEAAGLGERYVGAHPMAGTERSGFAASSADLLDRAPWAVTVPSPRPAGHAADRLEGLLRLVTGPLAGTAAVLTDDVHDEAAALVSHVPHVLATQLLNAVAGAPVRDAALGLAAGSFRDGTRVAHTDPARTEAMVVENAAWVAPVLRKTVRDLEALVAALETNAPVHGFFHAADDVRAAGRPGQRAARTADVTVPLEAGWPERVVERCEAGSVVVALTDTEVLLTR
ncbi:Prephenate dehydrogenase [Xylanimonas cellulosilytica DSM 15894]|uniref:Prephenate dehydrogenase n=1 Tax=Xylanimonas cellulosilytica (strain DSM 15894 / JCM 12276 / CECT 5975 / KCTC 9989 / LMG 20990 / NBRC 107835 / XIL07) TaxID=446471 RepID=D1BYS4_XYLCX|nr:prephenate dehydrogenase/arogenate dehydrogenase family protein [Xylanimonas cellulosilytica]ACZ29999.1 Prephenate dehydrogenase [Xylanimonas cellulosilytica DSM 15894]